LGVIIYEGKEIREDIVYCLLQIVDCKAIQHLIDAFNDLNEYYYYSRKDILKVIMQIGEAAVEPLIDSLYAEDHNIRKNAAEILGKIRDARAVEPLINALEDRYPSVRMMVANALINLPDTRTVKPLIKTLKDSDYNIRWRSAEALGNIGDARAVEPLINALEDTEIKVRLESIKALGKIADERAEEALVKILNRGNSNGIIKQETVKALKLLKRKNINS
jgi:HEAT repeat protein